MKFGILFQISVPRPWGPETERTIYQNCIEQAVLADSLGFDCCWAVEHHFLEEYSHCPAPEVFLAAVAAKTRRMRVGQAITLGAADADHPVRMAERAAVLDLVSDGRLELAMGCSAFWSELGGFGSDPGDTMALWDEAVRILPKMWTEDRTAHDGVHFSMPERAILPKPYQKPHPPLWGAVTSAEGAMDAAERGLGSLGLAFEDFDVLERRVRTYRERIARCEPVGSFVNDQIATLNLLYCHKDAARGVETGSHMADTLGQLAASFVSAGEVHAAGSGGTGRGLAAGAIPGESWPVPSGLAAGDPRSIIETLRGWEATGVDGVNFLLNAAEILPQAEVLSSLRLFAEEVMPAFKRSASVRAAE